MEELERFLSRAAAKAYDRFGWKGVLVVIAIFLLIAVGRALFDARELISKRIFLGATNPNALRISFWSFLFLTVIALFFIPSNPVVAVGALIALLLLVSSLFIYDPTLPKIPLWLFACLLLCSSLTFGGFVHDLVFPPTAQCSDGTYSSSRNRPGTCSWHGGVQQWEPSPWWQTLIR